MKPKGSSPASRFDEKYFRRYYGDEKTRVTGEKEISQLVRAVVSLAGFWGMPLANALDLGAGVGHWKRALARELPRLSYRGVDLSPVACARYGHVQASIASYRVKEHFDLVICQGVLQYLDDKDAAAALRNIGAMAGGLLYLEALTKHDVDEVADLTRTDADVHLRTGAWYRKRLAKDFITLGCGLYAARRAGAMFFELEQADLAES